MTLPMMFMNTILAIALIRVTFRVWQLPILTTIGLMHGFFPLLANHTPAKKHSGDARAFSFLRILELIQEIKRPPSMLFVENVVGFETSDTRTKMIEILVNTDFVTQEFILSPLQFGVPYSRPRYFCLAKRKPLCFRHRVLDNQLVRSCTPLLEHNGDILPDELDQPSDSTDKLLQSCKPVEHFLEFKDLNDQETTRATSNNLEVDLGEHGGASPRMSDQYFVPASLIDRWGNAMDIVYPDSRRCCCFTKSYYRYVKGTGSLLATIQPLEEGKTTTPLKEQGLRFFTPREVANMHSFPMDFEFPQHISLKQRYALLGNSLSVAVVAPLFSYLFDEPS